MSNWGTKHEMMFLYNLAISKSYTNDNHKVRKIPPLEKLNLYLQNMSLRQKWKKIDIDVIKNFCVLLIEKLKLYKKIEDSFDILYEEMVK